MAATFDINLSTTKDKMRFVLGDFRGLSGSTVTYPLLTDETYAAVIALQPVQTYAAALCADAIAAVFSQEADEAEIGKTRLLRRRAEKFVALAKRLRMVPGDLLTDGAGGLVAYMHVGGLDRSEVDDIRQNSDVTQQQFNLGQDDISGIAPPEES